MINEMKAELLRILHHTRQILEHSGQTEETAAAAQKIDASVRKLLGQSEPKICPECGHLFRGNGWDGIDAHWRAKHESVMSYAEAWPLIKSGIYRKSRGEQAPDLFSDE